MTPWENTLCGSQSGGLFWQRWEIWKKYKELFSTRKFLFIEEISSNVSDINFLIFINANAFLKKVYAYKSTFEKILGYKIVPENISDSINNRTLKDDLPYSINDINQIKAQGNSL